MRISDWSSDVCSSDLLLPAEALDDPLKAQVGMRDAVERGDEAVIDAGGLLVVAVAAGADHEIGLEQGSFLTQTCGNERLGLVAEAAILGDMGLKDLRVGFGVGLDDFMQPYGSPHWKGGRGGRTEERTGG